ncbi:MAG: hypothetical protein GY756_25555 [bacterium]|nr:hypothetical protein [bacterium]
MINAQSKVFDYPIKPGTKEWAELKTYDEKLNAYNIPEYLLVKMNTRDLVKTCLNYPEFRLMMTRNSLQLGYDYIKSIFNGFRELELRKDAGKEILKLYKNNDPSKIHKCKDLLQKGKYAYKFTCFEIILAQESILKSISKSDKIDIIKNLISNFEMKEKLPKEYSIFDLSPKALVLGRLMRIYNYLEFDMKYRNNELNAFVEYSNLGDKKLLKDIINLSNGYLKQLEND